MRILRARQRHAARKVRVACRDPGQQPLQRIAPRRRARRRPPPSPWPRQTAARPPRPPASRALQRDAHCRPRARSAATARPANAPRWRPTPSAASAGPSRAAPACATQGSSAPAACASARARTGLRRWTGRPPSATPRARSSVAKLLAPEGQQRTDQRHETRLRARPARRCSASAPPARASPTPAARASGRFRAGRRACGPARSASTPSRLAQSASKACRARRASSWLTGRVSRAFPPHHIMLHAQRLAHAAHKPRLVLRFGAQAMIDRDCAAARRPPHRGTSAASISSAMESEPPETATPTLRACRDETAERRRSPAASAAKRPPRYFLPRISRS